MVNCLFIRWETQLPSFRFRAESDHDLPFRSPFGSGTSVGRDQEDTYARAPSAACQQTPRADAKREVRNVLGTWDDVSKAQGGNVKIFYLLVILRLSDMDAMPAPIEFTTREQCELALTDLRRE